MGSGIRIRELSFGLEKSGAEVYVFTPYEQSFDLTRNVHVVSTNNLLNKVGLSRSLYRLTRFAYYNKAFPSLFSKVELQSNKIFDKMVRGMAKLLRVADVDVIQVEQDVALPIGIGLKRETGLPLVVDVHNISSEELVAAGVLEKDSDRFVALQNRTKKYLGGADRVVVVSEPMRDYAVEHYGLRSANIRVVPPGGRSFIDKAIVERRSKPVKIAYAGLVAFREHVDLFVRSMPFVSARDASVQFYITNKGEAVEKVKKLADGLGVKPVFVWHDDYGVAKQFLSTCHIGVLPSSGDVARKMGTPAKLFNYMSVGLPVVANDIGGWTEIIRKEKVGLVTSNDPKDFGEALASLAGDPRAMREYGFRGLELTESKYSWDNSAKILLETYEDLTGKS